MAKPTFKLLEFNRRREMRNIEAARFETTNGYDTMQLLWMSKRDICNNIEHFIDSDISELHKGLAAYNHNWQKAGLVADPKFPELFKRKG